MTLKDFKEMIFMLIICLIFFCVVFYLGYRQALDEFKIQQMRVVFCVLDKTAKNKNAYICKVDTLADKKYIEKEF